MDVVQYLKGDLEFLHHQAPLIRMALDYLASGEKRYGFDFAIQRFTRTVEKITRRRFTSRWRFDSNVIGSLACIALGPQKLNKNKFIFDYDLTEQLKELLYGELTRGKVAYFGRPAKKTDRAIRSRKEEK